MIYNKAEYKIKFYCNPITKFEPVRQYINDINDKDKQKVQKYLEFLRLNKGYLDEPYSRHIIGKLRELRVDIDHNFHRIIYFTYINKNIILLHAFLKKTKKTPFREKIIALRRYQKLINQ